MYTTWWSSTDNAHLFIFCHSFHSTGFPIERGQGESNLLPLLRYPPPWTWSPLNFVLLRWLQSSLQMPYHAKTNVFKQSNCLSITMKYITSILAGSAKTGVEPDWQPNWQVVWELWGHLTSHLRADTKGLLHFHFLALKFCGYLIGRAREYYINRIVMILF